MSGARTLGVAVFAVELLATGAFGQSLPFSSDLESGTLLTSDSPAGDWTSLQTYNPLTTVTVTAGSAHRGSFGLALIDQDPAMSNGGQVRLDVSHPPVAGAYHMRTWFRARGMATTGVVVFQLMSSPTIGLSILDLELNFPGGQLVLAGGDVTHPVYFIDPTNVVLADGRWHLIEQSIEGIGTGEGARHVWVDGALASERTGLDYTGWTAGGIGIGQPWSTATDFTGELDFDDYRISQEPLASQFTWTLPPSADVGQCLPLGLGLVDSSGAAATSPYALDSALSVAGLDGAAFYGSAGCASPVSFVSWEPNAARAASWLAAPSAAAGTVTATQVDLLPGTAPLSVQQPSSVSLRVGCAACPESLALLGGLVLLALTRSRAQWQCARPRNEGRIAQR